MGATRKLVTPALDLDQKRTQRRPDRGINLAHRAIVRDDLEISTPEMDHPGRPWRMNSNAPRSHANCDSEISFHLSADKGMGR